MKLITSLAISASVALTAVSAQAQQTITASTTPVGAVELTIPAGSSVIAPLFVNANEFQGVITSLAEQGEDTVITFSASSFTASEFDQGVNFPRFYAEVVAGDNEGFGFDIISNTANSITVAGSLVTDYGITTDDVVAIREHVTVGQLFGDVTGFVAFADTVKFFNDDGTSSVYLWDGSQFSGNGNERPVYPGTGFLTNFSAIVDVVTTGTVKTTATQVPVFAETNSINLISTNAPVSKDLQGLGLGSQINAFSAAVKLFNQGDLSTDAVYLSDGTSLIGADGKPVPAGDAILITVDTQKNIHIPAAYTE